MTDPRAYVEALRDRRECPDGAACHHSCEESCWRVHACVPLPLSGWEDWPEEVKAANPPVARFEDYLIRRENEIKFGPTG